MSATTETPQQRADRAGRRVEHIMEEYGISFAVARETVEQELRGELRLAYPDTPIGARA